MPVMTIIVLAWIATVDYRTHRISNRSLLILGVVGLTHFRYSKANIFDHLFAFVLITVIAVLLAIICGLGMGDVKLLAVLALLVLPPALDSYQIFVLTLLPVAIIHSMIIFRGKFWLSQQIPLAPTIFIATIATIATHIVK